MSNRNVEKRQEMKEHVAKKARVFGELFSTPNGKKVLEALEQEFEPVEIFDPNPHKTSYNAGRRDVVQYIKQMVRFSDVNP